MPGAWVIARQSLGLRGLGRENHGKGRNGGSRSFRIKGRRLEEETPASPLHTSGSSAGI